MRLAVVPMEVDDISQVLEIDRESYSLPWPASAYRREILHNRNARYFVLRQVREEDELDSEEPPSRAFLPLPFFRRQRPEGSNHHGAIVGYAGMWMMVDEAHITTIAVRPAWRGKGLGELLLASLVESAAEMGAQRLTLEVRVSNETAQNLYRKYGFHQQGVRPRYYSDDNEDAYIMTTDRIADDAYRDRFDLLVGALRDRLSAGEDAMVAAPAFDGGSGLS